MPPFLKRAATSIPPSIWAMALVLAPLAWRTGYRLFMQVHAPETVIGPPDPDIWLRLTLVRDWLMGGSWYSHEMLHSNAPDAGIASPWTRPVDLVIALLVKLQWWSAPINLKLMHAATVMPLIWMTLLLYALMRGAARLSNPPALCFMVAGLIYVTPGVWNYFGPGNADHHAPLCALWAWALYLLLSLPTQPRHATTLGVILALMLWISPEAMIFIGLVYVWLALVWLQNGDGTQLTLLRTLTRSVACGALLATLVERPPTQWLTIIDDSISILQVGVLAGCALAVQCLAWLPRTTFKQRILASALTAGGLIAAIAALYPDFFHGPMVHVDPYIKQSFLPQVDEAKPIFEDSNALAFLWIPLLSILGYALLWVRQPALIARQSIPQMLFFLVATTVLFSIQNRWQYYLFPVLIMALAPLLAALLTPEHPEMRATWPARWLLKYSNSGQSLRRIGVLFLVMGAPALLSSLPSMESPNTTNKVSKLIPACERMARKIIYNGALVKGLGNPPLNLYISTNLGGEIMFFTPYHIVASNYHREGVGMHYLATGMGLKKEASFRTHLAKRKINALLLCTDPAAGADSYATQLQRGTALPSWLQPVPIAMPHMKKTSKKRAARPRVFLVQQSNANMRD